ncbi:ParA family protein [Cellulosilyticum sp. I15G10I2]|uniref:ParA family protein n=1 Tax=Cellulosilyticum sp. I15G10I2 TaxID=1892843 RepID=UPI00085C1DFD|nr:AAA family ATPase [Cellulosilyticum sp. I15G10I2]
MASATHVLCFVNNKGGSGKSTTCANIGYSLASLGYKILLIDGDMQLNLSLNYFDEDFILEAAKSHKNLYYAVKEQKDLSDYITPTRYPSIDMILSSTLMSSIEYELFTKWQREYILKNSLKTIVDSKKYDYILIDSPPTLGGWVMNILCASHYMITPVEASPWGLFGLANLFDFLNDIKYVIPELKMLGICITKADTRKSYLKQTITALEELQNTHVFETYIKVDSAIEWSQENGKPVMDYKKSSRSANEYLSLAKEVDARVNQ